MTGVKLQAVTSDANGVQALIEGHDKPLQASRMILLSALPATPKILALR